MNTEFEPAKGNPFTFANVSAKFLINDFTGICRKLGTSPTECGIPAEDFGQVMQLFYIGVFTRHQTRDILKRRIQSLQKSTSDEAVIST